MPRLNPPTPAEILALVDADPSRDASIGAVDAAWIQANSDNRGLASVVSLEYAKIKDILVIAGLDYTALTNVQWGAAFNALCYACIYQFTIIDYELRVSQGNLSEPMELHDKKLKISKDAICRNLNQLQCFSEEYCGTGFEKVYTRVLTPTDLC